jgi:hypothetical protein
MTAAASSPTRPTQTPTMRRALSALFDPTSHHSRSAISTRTQARGAAISMRERRAGAELPGSSDAIYIT